MELLLSICLGIALSAACGFRVFVPLLALSAASLAGHVELAGSFAWMASWPALVALAVATVLEIAAFYIPVVDHLLDGIAAPVATVAGIAATAACVTEVSPLLQWSLAAIVGGGVAGATHLANAKLRLASTATTAGLGNPVLATAELGGATALSALGMFFPLLAAIGALVLLAALGWLALRLVKRAAALAGRVTAAGR